jgi:hypothetical protein
MNRRFFGLCAIALVTAMPALLQGKAAETRLRATLTGPRIVNLVPSGHADFRARQGQARLNVQVEDVKVAIGSVLDIYLNGAKIGAITVDAVTLGGEMELNSQDGDLVPAVAGGSVLVVRFGDKAVLAGVF